MTDNQFLALLAAYSVVLIGLGVGLSRYVKGASDFFVAGRRLSGGLVFTTFLAANIGAGSTVGATGLGYKQGLSAWWWVGSAGIGSLVLAFFVGPKIYALSRQYNLYTVGDYLEHRYSHAVRMFFAVVLWVLSLSILAGQLIAIAWILDAAAHIPKPLGCALGGIVVTAYFTAGGLFSTAWVNVVQLSVKMAGFIIAVPWVIHSIGGWSRVQAGMNGTASNGGGGLGYAVILIPSFIVSPGLIQKLFGARDETAVRRGVGVQAVVLLAYAFLPVLLGMAAFAAFPGLANPELALPTALKQLLPGWLGALLLAAVFSAELSASDAVLFMLSTSVAKDLYRDATDRKLLKVTRVAALLGGAAGTLAAIALPSVIDALKIFYGMLSVVLFVPMLAGLYSRRPTAATALAAMIVSAAVALFAPFWAGILAGAAIMIVAGFYVR